MNTPSGVTAPESDAAAAVRRAFYDGDLQGAANAGHAALAHLDALPQEPAVLATRARILLWLARSARRADQPDQALTRAYEGLAAARAAGDPRIECQLRAQTVHVLAGLGQCESALDEGYQVLQLSIDSRDVLAQAGAWLALGHVHWTQQQWRDGEKAYGQALDLARQCGDPEVRGLASNGIAAMEDHYATVARAEGRLTDAQVHARRSIELVGDFTLASAQVGDAYNAWSGGHNHACCLFALGEHAAARALLGEQLLALDGEAGFRRHLILQVLGDIEAAEGRTDLAIALQTEALEIALRLQMPMFAMNACRSLVDVLERSGDVRAALAQHRVYHDLYVQLASTRSQAHARAMAVKFETEKTLALAQAQRLRADLLASANSSLIEEKAQLQRFSMEDALTGLANRRKFDETWAQALQADALPAGRALALLDLDHFKRINDRYSHLVGDEVLRRVGALLLRTCRRQDLAARYGGEELVLLLEGVDRAQGLAACERVCVAIAAEPWRELHPQLQVTVSIGVVHEDEAPTPHARHALLATADARLYAAKQAGRNRVVGADLAPSDAHAVPAGRIGDAG